MIIVISYDSSTAIEFFYCSFLFFNTNQEYGYCINFESCNVPCGYVIYSERLGEIEEFCLDYGVNGISDNITQKENNHTDIYRESVWKYDKLKGHITNYNTESTSQMLGSSKVDIFDLVMDNPDVADNNNYELETYNYLRYRSMYSEDEISSWGLNYGCVPVALLNICKQSGFLTNTTFSQLKKAYTDLFSIAGTNSRGIPLITL